MADTKTGHGQEPQYIPMSPQATGQQYQNAAQPPQYGVQTPTNPSSPTPQPSQMGYQQQPTMSPNPVHLQGQVAAPQGMAYAVDPAAQYQYQQQANDGRPPMQAQNSATGQTASPYKTAVPIAALGMSPAPVDCPSCATRAMTRVSYHAGNTTHAWAGVIFCFTLCLCFIPYMMNSLKDVEHRCGNCGVRLATWHKSGAIDVHMHA